MRIAVIALMMMMMMMMTTGAAAQSLDQDRAEDTEIAFQLQTIEGTWFWKQKDEDHIKIKFEEPGKSFKGYPLLEVQFFEGWKQKTRKRFSFDATKSEWCEGSLERNCQTHFKLLKDPNEDYLYLVFQWNGHALDDYTYKSQPGIQD